jgi:hypothetical protein
MQLARMAPTLAGERHPRHNRGQNLAVYLVRRVQQRGLLGAVHVVHIGARVQQHLRKCISIRSRSDAVDIVKPYQPRVSPCSPKGGTTRSRF